MRRAVPPWAGDPSRRDRRVVSLGAAQGWACRWCRRPCVAAPGRADTATIDHLVPRSAGGRDGQENLVMACRECNGRRGSMPAAEWEILLAAGAAGHGDGAYAPGPDMRDATAGEKLARERAREAARRLRRAAEEA